MSDFEGFEGPPEPASDAPVVSGPRDEAHPSVFGPPVPDAASGALPPMIYGPPAPSQPARSRKRILVAGVAAILVIVAVAVGVVSTSSTPSIPGAGVAPADFVVSSTQNTLAQHTADITISGPFSDDGRTLPMTGSGFADFENNDFSATLSMSANSYSYVAKELVVGGKFLMAMTVNDTDIVQYLTGDEWVEIPIPDQGAGSLGAGNVDPLNQIEMMAKKGATVVPLGTSTINGVTVSGYDVTPSHQELVQNIQQEVNDGTITQSQANQLTQGSSVIGNFTLGVYFDANGLLQRETAHIAGGSSGATGQVTADFTNYGTPVTITVPPSSDIVSFSNFMQADQAAAADTKSSQQ